MKEEEFDLLKAWVWDFWRWQYFHCLIDAPNECHQAVGAEIPEAVEDAIGNIWDWSIGDRK